jgi:hypothetical protein
MQAADDCEMLDSSSAVLPRSLMVPTFFRPHRSFGIVVCLSGRERLENHDTRAVLVRRP